MQIAEGKNVLAKPSGYYLRREGFRQLKLGRTKREAVETLRKLRAGSVTQVRSVLHPTKAAQREAFDLKRCKGQMMGSMRARARARSQDVMTNDEFEALWAASDGRCAVTGIAFSMERIPGKTKRPWAPSIDRKDTAIGYVAGNCRIVCSAVNLAMNEWGEDVLLTIAAYLQLRHG